MGDELRHRGGVNVDKEAEAMSAKHQGSRISGHIRSNVLAYVAVFIALGGTAWAGTKVGADDIKDDAVLQKHISPNAIGSPQIASGAAKAAEIGKNAVGSDEIDDDGVQQKDLGPRSVGGPQVAASAIGSDEIADNGVQGKDLAGGSVGASQVATSAVGSEEIADGAVGTSDMAKGAITGPSIGNQAVAEQHLSFDIATQAELNTLSVSDGSPPNANSSLVHWDVLTGVPADFADGTDDTGGGGGSDPWLLDGNLATDPATNFLGTIDEQPLNLRVFNVRGFRLEPADDGPIVSPNVIGGIADNAVTAGVFAATIAGGSRSNVADPATANRVTDHRGTVGGGVDNQAGNNAGSVADALAATVGGGHGNTASGGSATVGGGQNNTASGADSTVGGGGGNTASGADSTVGGGDGNNAADIHTTVGGGSGNAATADRATIGGGRNNTANGVETTVSGGDGNTAGSFMATVGGGSLNTASGAGATVGGGSTNTASGAAATIAGGSHNTATLNGATVGGGGTNHAIANGATVAGGANNVASGNNATVAGGTANVAAGDFSFLTGQRAKNTDAAHDGVFLFADSSNSNFDSAAANEFAVRSTGGARVVTAIDGTTGDPTAGVKLDPGDTAWEVLSDRAAKENVVAISPEEILERLASVPITQWNYKAQDDSIRHIGPMAQDFHRAFGLSGDDRTHLSPIDTDGVALAAIKGLNERFDDFAAGATDGAAASSSVSPAATAGIAALCALVAAALGVVATLRWGRRFERSWVTGRGVTAESM